MTRSTYSPARIGVTGGIGSGKTSVCKIFETLGIPVYYSDIQAKRLMNTDPELKASIAGYFGKDIYGAGGLDRHKLAGIVFRDRAALEKLNSLVHPVVASDFKYWCTQQKAPYLLEESAIIFESNLAHRFEKIILITAPDAIRIQRVCTRDRLAPEIVQERMNNQWTDEVKTPAADFIILNDNTHLIIPQTVKIHRQLLEITSGLHYPSASSSAHPFSMAE